MLKFFLRTAATAITLACASATLVSAAGFSISQPIENSSIQGNVVTVKVSPPENFQFSASQIHTRPVYGEGHVHLWLDTQKLSSTSAVQVNSGTYVFENVKYGPHVLTAEWVSNNDARSAPPIVSSVSFSTIPVPAITKDIPSRQLTQTLFLLTILAIVSLYLISHHFQTKVKTKTTKKKSKK